MTPFLSLPPSRTLFPPTPSAPVTQSSLTTPLKAITEIKVQVTLPLGWHGTFALEVTQITVNTAARSCSVTGKCHEIAWLLRKSFVAFKTSTTVFNIINKMSVNCRLLIYQLTTNFLANCQLTTIILANCQLTTNPISTLVIQCF